MQLWETVQKECFTFLLLALKNETDKGKGLNSLIGMGKFEDKFDTKRLKDYSIQEVHGRMSPQDKVPILR